MLGRRFAHAQRKAKIWGAAVGGFVGGLAGAFAGLMIDTTNDTDRFDKFKENYLAKLKSVGDDNHCVVVTTPDNAQCNYSKIYSFSSYNTEESYQEWGYPEVVDYACAMVMCPDKGQAIKVNSMAFSFAQSRFDEAARSVYASAPFIYGTAIGVGIVVGAIVGAVHGFYCFVPQDDALLDGIVDDIAREQAGEPNVLPAPVEGQDYRQLEGHADEAKNDNEIQEIAAQSLEQYEARNEYCLSLPVNQQKIVSPPKDFMLALAVKAGIMNNNAAFDPFTQDEEKLVDGAELICIPSTNNHWNVYPYHAQFKKYGGFKRDLESNTVEFKQLDNSVLKGDQAKRIFVTTVAMMKQFFKNQKASPVHAKSPHLLLSPARTPGTSPIRKSPSIASVSPARTPGAKR